MKIDVYSDVVCPWCYIGERRLAAALEKSGRAGRAIVAFRPFQLDPGAPPEAAPLRAHLERRFGPRVDAMLRHVTAVAADEGITMNWDAALTGNTHSAHRLLQLALEEYGPGVQRALLERLFALHFTHGGDITDHTQLTVEAVAVGMSRARVEAYLASDEGSARLTEAFERARRRGITAVPTFVVNDRYVVQGAQPVGVLIEAFERIAAAEEAEAGADADSCGDQACAR